MAKVEVVFLPKEGALFQKYVPYSEGLTVEMAMAQSGLTELYPEVLSLEKGTFSKRMQNTDILKPTDRLEIYHPLLGCPKEKRRKRAKS